MRERRFVKLSTIIMRIISKSFEVSARKVTQRYLRFIPKYMTIFLQTRIYMRTKKPIYIVTNKHVVYGVTESRRITGTELYRQEKTPFMYDGAEE